MKYLKFDLKLTELQIVEQTLHFLVRQGTRAIIPDSETCLYRTESGDKACAVGAWIPDSNPHLNCMGGIYILIANMEATSGVSDLSQFLKNNRNLFQQLQCFHDSNPFVNFAIFCQEYETLNFSDFNIPASWANDWGIGNE